jgi:hypothetical protein
VIPRGQLSPQASAQNPSDKRDRNESEAHEQNIAMLADQFVEETKHWF